MQGAGKVRSKGLHEACRMAAGIKLVLNSRVAAVEDGCVKVVNKANETTDIKFGACVWATGIAMNPLIKMMQEKLPGQGHFRCGQGRARMRVCIAQEPWL